MQTKSVETIREFVDFIKVTRIDGAKELLEDYEKNLGEVWKRFLTYAATPTSIRYLRDGISRHVLLKSEVDTRWRAALEPFLDELECKARFCEIWQQVDSSSDEI